MKVEEPVRLVCPDCELVYKVKRLTLGKEYKCRQCGGNLRSLESVTLGCPVCGERADVEHLDPMHVPHCEKCAEAPSLTFPPKEEPPESPAAASDTRTDSFESIIARENTAAMNATGNVAGDDVSRPRSARLSPESDLARLPRLIEDLTARLDLLRNVGIGDGGEPADTAGKLLESTQTLGENLSALNADLTRDMRELDARVAGLLEKLAGEDLSSLAEQVRETGSLFLSRLEEYREAQKVELAALLTPAPSEHSGTTVEVDIDELADRLVAGIRLRTPLLDTESGSAVDALAKVADELVKEQSTNSGRLDTLATEIRSAISGISRMDEWRGELPLRVADEISRTVEERVVGPVSNALSRQAPAILSDLQDNKLVDIVSRSVREAQRPLLREILMGGRQGVPAWLFASVLLPLLLILGYLFLPGELGFGDNATKLDGIVQSLESMRKDGVSLNDEAFHQLQAMDEQLQAVGGGVADIHQKAMEHVRNAATLEQHVKNLEATLKEREALLEEYKQTLDAQVKRINLYETRLIQLGVPPNTIQ